MSQFRIKKVDLGLPDEWVLRTNDDGAALGDDIVAEDPNDLAGAMSDTQDLLLKASVYAPASLLNPNSGALERIKLLEDNVGSISLQDAYDNGNYINVTPGVPLSLGSGGVIVVDSLNNLTINPSVMKVVSGSQEMMISHTGIQSSTTNMTVGTSSPSRDLTLIGGNEIYFGDGNLISAIKLSELGTTTLATTSQSLVGAINEISGGFTSTDLQQIYDQSTPPKITTTVGSGSMEIENGTGSAFTPALKVTGILEVSSDTKVDTLKVGSGLAVNLTINPDGSIETVGDIKTTTRVVTGLVEAEVGTLTLKDSLGDADLTSVTDSSLATVKQTIFGSINEVNTIATQNASSLAAFAIQHDTSTGYHEVIITQADPGFDTDDRFVIKNSSGANVVMANALGLIEAQDVKLGVYNLAAEAVANDVHRNGGGSDHADVAAHFLDPNPHDVVKHINRQGSPQLTGDVVLKEGPGITLVQSGSDIEISAAAGSTLQGVYDSQVSGDWTLGAGKNLNMKNDIGQDIASFGQAAIDIHKDINIKLASKISSDSLFIIESTGDVQLQSTTSDVSISSTGGSVILSGTKFASTVPEVLPGFMPDTVMGTINQGIAQRYHVATNNTNETIKKGTAVNIDYNNSIWTVLVSAETIPDELFYRRCFGLADEDIPSGNDGRIKVNGIIFADIGKMDTASDGGFQPGDTLYIARQGYGQVELSTIGLLANGDTITVDAGGSGLTFTAKGSPVSDGEFRIYGGTNVAIKEFKTLDSFIEQVNNITYQTTNGSGAFRAFHDGKEAEAHINLTGACAVGDTFTVGAQIDVGVIGQVFTAVALGSKAASSQFEVGTTAAHTAKNLAESINENRTGLNAVRLVATASGGYLHLRADVRNVGMNAVALSTTSVDITTPANLSGGKSIARIFTLNRDAGGKTMATSNTGAITTTDFGTDESESQYVADRRVKNLFRESDAREAFLKVGKVLSQDPANPSPTDLRILIDIEEPYVIIKE